MPNIVVQVRTGNLEVSLKRLKKRMQAEETFKVLKNKSRYEKPSEKIARKKAEAFKKRFKNKLRTYHK